MKWIFGLLILFLMSSVAVSNHTPHRNRVSHRWNLWTEANAYGTGIDRDNIGVLESRSRTSSRHDAGNQKWTAISEVRCKNASYEGHWGFANYTPHEISNLRGRDAGEFSGIFFLNARVIGLRPNVTSDSRVAVRSAAASGDISAWIGSPSAGNVTHSESSVPW